MFQPPPGYRIWDIGIGDDNDNDNGMEWRGKNKGARGGGLSYTGWIQGQVVPTLDVYPSIWTGTRCSVLLHLLDDDNDKQLHRYM